MSPALAPNLEQAEGKAGLGRGHRQEAEQQRRAAADLVGLHRLIERVAQLVHVAAKGVEQVLPCLRHAAPVVSVGEPGSRPVSTSRFAAPSRRRPRTEKRGSSSCPRRISQVVPPRFDVLDGPFEQARVEGGADHPAGIGLPLQLRRDRLLGRFAHRADPKPADFAFSRAIGRKKTKSAKEMIC